MCFKRCKRVGSCHFTNRQKNFGCVSPCLLMPLATIFQTLIYFLELKKIPSGPKRWWIGKQTCYLHWAVLSQQDVPSFHIPKVKHMFVHSSGTSWHKRCLLIIFSIQYTHGCQFISYTYLVSTFTRFYQVQQPNRSDRVYHCIVALPHPP